MRIEISTKFITLDQEAKDRIITKLSRLSHFISSPRKTNSFITDENAWLALEVIHTTEHHKKGNVFDVEGKMHLKGNILKAGASGETVLSCVDKVEDELKRQLLKVKAKHGASERKTRKIVRAVRGKD